MWRRWGPYSTARMQVSYGRGWCLHDSWLCPLPSPLPCTLSGQSFILLEGVNEEIVCSCLGSQGKLLGLIHVPLGSYSGEERCNVEIQEF